MYPVFWQLASASCFLLLSWSCICLFFPIMHYFFFTFVIITSNFMCIALMCVLVEDPQLKHSHICNFIRWTSLAADCDSESLWFRVDSEFSPIYFLSAFHPWHWVLNQVSKPGEYAKVSILWMQIWPCRLQVADRFMNHISNTLIHEIIQ